MTVMLLTLAVTQSTTRRGRAAVTSSHFDYGLTEALTRKHAVERCWQVLQPFCDVGLELHSSVRESRFELLPHLGDQMLPRRAAVGLNRDVHADDDPLR